MRTLKVSSIEVTILVLRMSAGLRAGTGVGAYTLESGSNDKRTHRGNWHEIALHLIWPVSVLGPDV